MLEGRGDSRRSAMVPASSLRRRRPGAAPAADGGGRSPAPSRRRPTGSRRHRRQRCRLRPSTCRAPRPTRRPPLPTETSPPLRGRRRAAGPGVEDAAASPPGRHRGRPARRAPRPVRPRPAQTRPRTSESAAMRGPRQPIVPSCSHSSCGTRIRTAVMPAASAPWSSR